MARAGRGSRGRVDARARGAATTRRALRARGGSRGAGAGAIAAGWSVDGTPVCTSASLQYGPEIVPDGAQGALIFWSDDNTDPALATVARAQHLDGAGARVPGWPAEGLWCHGAAYGS